MSEAAAFYSVKMRAARGGAHISGAEKIVPAPSVPKVASVLVARALTHAKGVPDFVNLKVEAQPGPIRRLPALAVTTHATRTAAEMTSSTEWPVRRSFRPLAPKVLA